MLADEFPEMGLLGPNARGGASVSLVVYVPDVDATFARAVEAGATVDRDVGDQEHGSRIGTVVDPFGHRWMISTWIGTAEGRPEPAALRRGGNNPGRRPVERGRLLRARRSATSTAARAFFGGLFGWRFAEPGTSPDGDRSVHVESSTVPFGLSEGDRPFVYAVLPGAPISTPRSSASVELGGEVLEVHAVRRRAATPPASTTRAPRFELWEPGPGY